MGLLDFFRRKALTGTPAVVETLQERSGDFTISLGGTNLQSNRVLAAFQRAQAASYAFMYANQPAVRTVVDLIAENVSQLGLKLYDRVDENERRPDPEHPAAVTMRYPNDWTPADQMIEEIVGDFLVYNNAYVLKFKRGAGNPLTLVRLLPHMVAVLGSGLVVDGYRVYRSDGSFFDVEPGAMIHWRSYNPEDPRVGLSPLETLRQELTQDSSMQAALTEMAKNGLQGGYIERPLEAPEWSDEGMKRFREGWRNARKASPKQTPVLDEGMKFVSSMVSPKDAEALKSREFTLETIARVYGVPTGMFFRDGDQEQPLKRFYADVLAPISKKLACQLDHSIVQAEYMDTDRYFEFNMDEKLRGDIEQRLPNLVSAGGAPPMTRNEVRSLLNLPPMDGGEELITPLNVIVGDNPRPAPTVMPIQDPNGPPQDGSYREPKALLVSNTPPRFADMSRQRNHIARAIGVLEEFYARQLRSLGGKAAFDSARWDRELKADLVALISSIVEREGGIYVGRLAGNDFDLGQRRKYIDAMAGGIARKLNAVTQRDFEGEMTAREALSRASSERASIAGTQIGARSTVMARQEAAMQSPFPESRLQTWVANTDRHADLDGVSVPLGSDWGGIEPGSEANCGCSAVIQ